MAELSPMMQQYQKIKAENQGAILFFRLGDFMKCSLTTRCWRRRNWNDPYRETADKIKAPMCGVPYHSSESYIARLISKRL